MTVSRFESLDALSPREPADAPECPEHEDDCDDTCSIATAVIPAEGLE